jgi:cyclohexanone monooxygenase
MTGTAAPDHQTLIVGAGFSGIGAGILLDKAGLADYLIVDAADGPGGTWYWNTYPGIAVDIPSFSYQFSFEQSPDWSRVYAPGRELRAYAEHCVAKYGLRPRIRFGTTVAAAQFDDADQLWRVELGSGESLTARFLINASGVMTTPRLPDIDGLENFTGPGLGIIGGIVFTVIVIASILLVRNMNMRIKRLPDEFDDSTTPDAKEKG